MVRQLRSIAEVDAARIGEVSVPPGVVRKSALLKNRRSPLFTRNKVGKNAALSHLPDSLDQVPGHGYEQRARVAGTSATHGEKSTGVRIQPDRLHADVKVEAGSGIGVCVR